MGQISQSLGVGPEFEYDGKTYRLSPWTYRIQGEFERYLEDFAMRTVRRMKPYTTDPEYRELLASVHRDVASGFYNFGGKAASEAMGTLSHLQYLVLLCLKPGYPEVTPELVQKMFETKLEELMQKIGEANNDPNRTGPQVSEQPVLEASGPIQ